MRFSATTLFTLLPAAILAAPTTVESRAAEICAPTQYTLSDYFLTYSTETAHVEFKFASEFADPSIIQDAVIDGASCAASGETIPNNNECAVPGRNLLFDLAGAQQTAKYRIVHSWRCNGRTWMSNTPIEADSLLCNHQGSTGVTECHGEQNLVFTPQNVRQICSTPTCP